jgi:hypothetical protein
MMDTKQVKKIADKEVKAHESRMHGKKMAAGGVTSKAMMQMGRNMARVANQRRTGRGG